MNFWPFLISLVPNKFFPAQSFEGFFKKNVVHVLMNYLLRKQTAGHLSAQR